MFNFTQLGLSRVSVISEELFGGYYVVEVAEPLEPFAVASTISGNPIFDYIEFDAIGEFNIPPNDPLYTSQWNLPQISMPFALSGLTLNLKQDIILKR